MNKDSLSAVFCSFIEECRRGSRGRRKGLLTTIGDGGFVVVPSWGSRPAVTAGQAFRMKKKHAEEQRMKSARGREKSSDDIFVCERVCTSKRKLKKVGAFSKDPIPDTFVTVCGVLSSMLVLVLFVSTNIRYPTGMTFAFEGVRLNV